jgi:hypothetical protein
MAFPLPYLTFKLSNAADDVITALQDLLLDELNAKVGSTGLFESFQMVQEFDKTLVALHQMLMPPNMPKAQPFGMPGVPGGWSSAVSEMHGQELCQDEEVQGQPLAEIAQGSLMPPCQSSSEDWFF